MSPAHQLALAKTLTWYAAGRRTGSAKWLKRPHKVRL